MKLALSAESGGREGGAWMDNIDATVEDAEWQERRPAQGWGHVAGQPRGREGSPWMPLAIQLFAPTQEN